MMKKKLSIKGIIIIIGLLLISFSSYCQTYAIPDTNLRNKLITDYPSVMTGNLLNITAAGNLTGSLHLDNAGIANSDGIQYFTQITTLNLNNNLLKNLPDISGLTQLAFIFMSNNKLKSFPSLSTFSNLIDFQVAYNELTTLPSFTNNTNLINIYCQNNKLSSLPNISMLANLRVLDIGENNFTQLPDFSPLTNLEELHVHRTGIDTIIGLSALTNLKKLYAWGNKIRDLSGLNTNTSLETFFVFNNNLYSLPILLNKPALTVVSSTNNHLSFEDILPLISHPNFSAFSFHPQKKVPLSSYTLREKDSVTFNLFLDEGILNNVYTWYKDGDILTSNQTGILTISSIAYADSGKYAVQITNPGLIGLQLQSDSAKLVVMPCLEINSFDTEIISEKCKEGTTIQLASFNISGGIAPFNYSLVNASNPDTLYLTTPRFQNLTPGIYLAIVRDSRMCKASKSLSLSIPADCHLIISPNGDGVMDTYFIEEAGNIKIFDIGRNLIKELISPIEWDGRKSDGTMVDDGYYAIVINDKKVLHITVVK